MDLPRCSLCEGEPRRGMVNAQGSVGWAHQSCFNAWDRQAEADELGQHAVAFQLGAVGIDARFQQLGVIPPPAQVVRLEARTRAGGATPYQVERARARLAARGIEA